jgi:hypothetical protein
MLTEVTLPDTNFTLTVNKDISLSFKRYGRCIVTFSLGQFMGRAP